MKVLKFGGASIGTPDGFREMIRIIDGAPDDRPAEDTVVVVGAIGDTTDRLIAMARQAQRGDKAWEQSFNDLVQLHERALPAAPAPQKEVAGRALLFSELHSIIYGVSLISDLSRKTLATVVSYGERLCACMVAAALPGARLLDARQMIKTMRKGGKDLLDDELTYTLVRESEEPDVPGVRRLSVLAGYIGTDRDTGEVTNLGRGGADYTAAIVAAALEADELDIWTDIDGFMTADPHVIKSAYTIPEMSYDEAMELSNFDTRVIYPPTIYPVRQKGIPIRVRNLARPDAAGTVIMDLAGAGKEHGQKDEGQCVRLVRGISSIADTTLITVSGLSMVGVIGVNQRIFSALAAHDISTFFVAQASSENSTSIGVRGEDGEKARQVLDQVFAAEIADGSMFPTKAQDGLATVAVVGENMRDTPGVAGKVYGTLGRNGVSVIATAQGAAETNISFIVRASELRKTLNVLHDSFFLSEYKVLNLFVCGVGVVGGMLLEQISRQAEELKQRSRLKLNVVGIAASRNAIYSRDGIDLNNYRKPLRSSAPSGPRQLLENIVKMNMYNSVFVDCTASPDIAALYQPLLEHNVSVVAANKIAASSPYDNYARLKQTALQRGVKFLFETNVGAGLPIIGTINDLRNSGDRILRIEAVLSGTLNFIFNALAPDVPFSLAVRKAKDLGYSEPDPRIDLRGTDVARKIVILAREAGYRIDLEDVAMGKILPDDFFSGSLDDFWRRLPEVDARFEEQRAQLAKEGRRWRFVATLDEDHASTALKAVGRDHPFYGIEGSNNIVMLTTERYREYPMLIQGYGAGAAVTAAGVFANVMSIANI